MQIFITTFEAVAALLLIGLTGFFLIIRKVIPEKAISVLATIAVDVALPALVFSKIITSFNPEDMPDWWTRPLWWAGFMIAGIIAAFLLSFAAKKSFREEFRSGLVFNNAVFFPLAIITGVFSDENPLVTELFLFTLLFPPFYFAAVNLFFHGSRNAKIPLSKIFNPVLIATLIALTLVLTGLAEFVPQFAVHALKLTGRTAAPLLMMILGGSIYIDFRDKGEFKLAESVKFTIAKNIIFPLIALAAVFFLNIPKPVGFMIVLQAAVPPITSLSVMTERCGGERHITNQFIFTSFMASIITIPAFIMLYDLLIGLNGME
ncbi:AEC family transporter [Sedimentisphaera salicampi]|uniref:Auxin efflux carrier n=1 Tax=Sedimentisphaera salicampi TaxID=1941349 RepID=A0A1W6LIR1_9BACT|nr:AEC family transporter [Sedimentisphaera salicampi]ARN55671.1 auxin efflux carrier [Sedimentisphaera salicampi]OXU16190.1 auxin efflux carrier [Sedimentisphaera salicampi]